MVKVAMVGLGVLVLVLAHLLAARRFVAWGDGLVARMAAGPMAAAPRDDLPAPVAAMAQRGLAGAAPVAGLVQLVQVAEMEMAPGAGWQPLEARQAIATDAPGFVWQASQRRGPLILFRVVDAYVAGQGMLKARLFGSVPVADGQGAEFDRGEAMRYLAELPWAPDAILRNPAIRWQVLDGGEIEARLPLVPRDAVVRFTLDQAGDVVGMAAEDRPATAPGGQIELRQWRGRFWDHAVLGGRRIPVRGEVGYVLDGGYAPYWRGEVTGYRVE